MDYEGIVLSEITQTEKDKYRTISHVESKNKNKKKRKTKLIDTENILVDARGGEVGAEEMGEGNQKVQASSYKIN